MELNERASPAVTVDTPSPGDLDVNAMTEQFLSFFSSHLDNICIRIFANEAGLGVREKSMNDSFNINLMVG